VVHRILAWEKLGAEEFDETWEEENSEGILFPCSMWCKRRSGCVMGYTPNSLKLFLLPLLNSSTI
jgi:hypothetical protein